MNLLNEIKGKLALLAKTKSGASAATVLIIAAAFAFGFYVTNHTKVKDGPLEQAAESVLRANGIDYDFTPDD